MIKNPKMLAPILSAYRYDRITSYNVCYTKLLRHPQADGIARQRIPSLKATLDSSFLKIRFSYLYALNIGANIFGFLIIALLNLFTPLEFFKIQRAFLLAGGWVTIVSFYHLVIGLGIILQYIVRNNFV